MLSWISGRMYLIPVFLLLALLLIVPLVALTVLWALALRNLPPERRRGLLPVGCAMFLTAALLFPGEALLILFGLTWRFHVVWTAGILLWWLGLAAGILTVCYTHRWLALKSPAAGTFGVAAGLFCLLAAMGMGTIVGGIWLLDTAPSMEQVGEYEGRTVVQAGIAWDGGYHIYEYRGPLVRGSESLDQNEDPFIGELSLRGIDRTLGLDLSAGTVAESRDTHGGMGNDGETFVVVRFPDGSLVEQLSGWKSLPLPPELERLRQQAQDDAYPIPPDIEGLYWVRDDQNETDPSDGSHIFDGDRHSYNCALAVYDRESGTLYYYELDT